MKNSLIIKNFNKADKEYLDKLRNAFQEINKLNRNVKEIWLNYLDYADFLHATYLIKEKVYEMEFDKENLKKNLFGVLWGATVKIYHRDNKSPRKLVDDQGDSHIG